MQPLSVQQLLQQALWHHQAGRFQQAEALYRQVLERQPNHAAALNYLGMLALQMGRPEVAVELMGRSVQIAPNVAGHHANLAQAWHALGNVEQEIASYQKAVAISPQLAEVHYTLANLYTNLNRREEAIAALRQAISLRPDFAPAHNNLGNLLVATGQFDEAIARFRKAIQLKADYSLAYNNLGNALRSRGQWAEATESYRKALALNPDFPDALVNLGTSFQDEGDFGSAIEQYRRAVAIKPDYAGAFNNLANAFMNLGRLDEAIECYRKVIALEPRLWQAHSNLLQALLYHHGSEPAEIFREHLAWAARHAQPTDGGQARPCIQSKIQNPKSRIKIGYVSPDLRLHAVGFFIEPILQHHDHEQFEIYAYADVPRPDVVTARLQKCCDQWLSVVGMSDEQVIRQIQEDQIDILVDLAGHTADNRMRLFAAKPAPIQVTYLGYQATTGLSTMDWRITDAHADPPGLTEAYHTERLYRLPRVFACYRPPENCPEVGPLPALSSGHVTFVSFSRLSKITPPAMDLWAKILQEVPSSRLTILSRGLHDAAAQKRLRECFVSRGLAPERLGLLGERNFAEYLQFHNEVDLALDTFPFTGHTTTCHGLWMGLPIVTLAGQTYCSRMGTSVLSNLGLEELIARSPEEYVKIAVELANDLPRLAELRKGLRERMRNSPVMDAAGFTREMEEAYREMWRQRCAAP